MGINDFTKHSTYFRKDITKIVTGKDEKPYGKWVSVTTEKVIICSYL